MSSVNIGKKNQIRRLVVFDFDWSMIDTNSDVWIFKKLSSKVYEKIDQLSGKIQWTDLIDQLLGELHEEGITREQIEDVMSRVPFRHEMIETLKIIKENNGDIIILSDANTVFIDVILKANKVDHLISRIITNPAIWEDSGRLRVNRLHLAEIAPHGCLNKCALNICKGAELVNYLASFVEQQENYYDQILYVGDSVNDFCPATKMKSNDVLLARKDYRLDKFLNSPVSSNDGDDLGGGDRLKKLNKDRINARIVYWKDASDVLNIVKNEFERSDIVENI